MPTWFAMMRVLAPAWTTPRRRRWTRSSCTAARGPRWGFTEWRAPMDHPDVVRLGAVAAYVTAETTRFLAERTGFLPALTVIVRHLRGDLGTAAAWPSSSPVRPDSSSPRVPSTAPYAERVSARVRSVCSSSSTTARAWRGDQRKLRYQQTQGQEGSGGLRAPSHVVALPRAAPADRVARNDPCRACGAWGRSSA